MSSDDNFTPWRTVAEQISDFEEIKMASLYADIFQVDFFTPNEIISAEMTKAMLELVKHRLEFINSISPSDDTIRAVKKEDIRLWNKMVDYLKKALIYGHTSRISNWIYYQFTTFEGKSLDMPPGTLQAQTPAHSIEKE